MDTASVMMCTYNRLSLTQCMLDSFFQTTTSPYHLIIVDNGSADGTPEYLRTLQSKARPDFCQSLDIIFNAQNKGIATGRNQGLKKANDYNDLWLATLDNDVELPANWLQECIDIIQSNRNYTIGVNFEPTQYPLITKNGKTFQHKDKGNLGTACMVFHRNLHKAIGYFYGYDHYYSCEDSDWGMRQRIAGYQMGYLKDNGVHLGEGAADTGEYREWKTACHSQTLAPFQQRCRDYMSRKISVYIPYSEKT
jgi:O-antigen biosynthesis protein